MRYLVVLAAAATLAACASPTTAPTFTPCSVDVSVSTLAQVPADSIYHGSAPLVVLPGSPRPPYVMIATGELFALVAARNAYCVVHVVTR